MLVYQCLSSNLPEFEAVLAQVLLILNARTERVGPASISSCGFLAFSMFKVQNSRM